MPDIEGTTPGPEETGSESGAPRSEFGLNAEQRPAVEEHDRHLLLSAGAGSGKTRVLVERYLRILEDGDWDLALPTRILAITFTEKAALEMRERIVRSLEKRASSQGEPARAARLLELLREMESASISTIHGSCSRLLRENATEAGLDPRFRVPDELTKRGTLLANVTVNAGDGETSSPEDVRDNNSMSASFRCTQPPLPVTRSSPPRRRPVWRLCTRYFTISPAASCRV